MLHNQWYKKIERTFQLSESLSLEVYSEGQEGLKFQGESYEPGDLEWYPRQQDFPSKEDVACLVCACCDQNSWKNCLSGSQRRYLRREEWDTFSLHIVDLHKEMLVFPDKNEQGVDLPTTSPQIRIVESHLKMFPLGETVMKQINSTRTLSPKKRVIATLHRTGSLTLRRSERHRIRHSCHCGLPDRWVISIGNFATHLYSEPHHYVKKQKWVWTETELCIEKEEIQTLIDILPEVKSLISVLHFPSPTY